MRQPNRVRALRTDRLMTQEQLARKAHVSLRTISNIEANRYHSTRMAIMRKILAALGVPFEQRREVFLETTP